MIGKLKILGFKESACKLIKDYLTGRQTKTYVNGHLSSSISLQSGVGEGSVLGPLLYTLGQICVSIVCELTENRMLLEHGKIVHSLSIEFADDCTGGLAADNDFDLQIAINIMMEEYSKYFSSCGLCLNPDKCMVMVIRSKGKTLDIYWNGSREVSKAKLLGVWFDSKYNFEEHLNHVVRICSYKLSCLRKVATWLTRLNLQRITESIVISQIRYCFEVYGRTQKVRTKLQKILNSCARLILQKSRYENCERMMEELGWLNLDNFFRECQVLSLRRLMMTEHGEYTHQMFNLETRMYSVRKPLLKLTWHGQSEHGRTCFIQSSVRTWNDIGIGNEKFQDEAALKMWLKAKLKSYFGNHNLK